MKKLVFQCLAVFVSVFLISKAAFAQDEASAHYVVAHAYAKPDKVDMLKNELVAVAEKSREEEGCELYVLYQDKKNPAHFTLYEVWKTEADHQDHFNKPYIQDLIAKLDDLVVKPAEIHTLSKI